MGGIQCVPTTPCSAEGVVENRTGSRFVSTGYPQSESHFFTSYRHISHATAESVGLYEGTQNTTPCLLRIENSRNAFNLLLALCTYAVSITESGSQSAPPNYQWIQRLFTISHASEVWVNDMASSSVMEKGAARTGVYIEGRTFGDFDILKLYMKYSIPIWVCVAGDPTNKKIPEFLRFTPQQRNSAFQASTRPQQQQQQIPESRNGPPTRQRPGEPPIDFFKRQISANKRLVRTEAALNTIIRTDRQRIANTFAMPGRNGAHVFEWVNSVRTYVPRAQVPEIWLDYARTQKWFNPICNEWDLCREIYPAGVPEGDNEDNDDEYYGNYASEMAMPSIDQLSNLSQAIANTVYDEASDTVAITFNGPVREDTLFHRYGFHPNGSDYLPPQRPVSDLKLAIALAERSTEVAVFTPAARHFVIYMTSEGSHVPALLSDLRNGNLHCLCQHMSRTFTFRIRGDNLFEISGVDGVLLVPRPSYVTEMLCLSHCATVKELSIYFAKKGSRCHLGDPGHNINPFEDKPSPPAGLGIRSPNNPITKEHFVQYIHRQNKLLMDLPILRAALMTGGIIWRLAMDSMRANYRSLDFEQLFSDDDEVAQLTNFDLGVISGLYIIWTGKCLYYYQNIIRLNKSTL